MKKSVAAPALLALALAGCGGGGGGAGGTTTSSTPAPTPAVVITQSNAPTVAAYGLDAAQDNSSTSTAGLVAGVEVDASTFAGPRTLASVAQHMGQRAAGLQLATGVQVDQTAACSNGGTMHVSGSVSGSGGLAAGDTMTIAASNCTEVVDGVLTTMNGSLRMDITAGFMPDSGVPPYHVVMRVTATALSIQVGSNIAGTDGDMTLDLTVSSPTAEVLLVTGNSLTSSATMSGVTRSRTLSSYSQKVAVNGSAITSSMSGSVVTTSTRLGATGGSFTVSTPQDLGWTTTSNAPVAGQVKVVGAANSAVLVTFSASGATIQVDANGDGTYESSSTATVAQLRAML